MEVQMMTRGGWPLSVFDADAGAVLWRHILAAGRVADARLEQVLVAVADAWKHRRDEAGTWPAAAQLLRIRA